jgi:hypothetical protein
MDMFLHALQLGISINFELVFDLWYIEFCLSRRSIILLWTRRHARCLDYQICNT